MIVNIRLLLTEQNFRGLPSLLWSSLLIFSCSCSKVDNLSSEAFEPGVSSQEYSLNSVKTVKLTDEVGSIWDVVQDKLLGVSSDKSRVWIYDLTDSSFRELRIEGEGPGKTGDILKAYWKDSNSFVIHDIKGAYLYDLDGNLVRKCEEVYGHMNVGTISSGFGYEEEKVIVSALNPSIPVKKQGYFQNPDIFFFAELDFSNCSVTIGGKDINLPTYSSRLLPVRYRGYIENLNDEQFFLFFQYEKNLWIYDKNSFNHIKTLSLNPNHFTEIIGATEWSLQEMTRLAQINPAYLRMKALYNGTVLITQYSESSSEYKPSLEYLDGDIIRPKRWLEVYTLDPNYEKVKEIELPETFAVNPIMFGTNNKNKVYLYANEHNGAEGTFIVTGTLE